MKKILTIIFSLVITSAAIAETGFITSSASAHKELAPDTAEISIAVVTDDIKSMQNATIKNKELSDKLYKELKSMIGEQDYVKTSDFSAQPLYSYSSNKRTFDKYQVSNRIIVHTKAIDKTGEIIDRAIALGATNIDNLSFTLSSYETACDELLSQAAQKSKERAEKLAKSVNTTVTGVKSISGSCSTSGISPRMMFNNMKMEAATDSVSSGFGTPIETGVVKLYANVNASYFVK